MSNPMAIHTVDNTNNTYNQERKHFDKRSYQKYKNPDMHPPNGITRKQGNGKLKTESLRGGT